MQIGNLIWLLVFAWLFTEVVLWAQKPFVRSDSVIMRMPVGFISTFRRISNIRRIESQNSRLAVAFAQSIETSLSRRCGMAFIEPMHRNKPNITYLLTCRLSRECKWNWSSADRRCPNYIWVISKIIAYSFPSYIRDLTVISQTTSIGTIIK